MSEPINDSADAPANDPALRRAAAWVRRRTSRSRPDDVGLARALLAGRTVSVVIPARNEVGTVGLIVEVVAGAPAGLVSEVLVVDDASSDGTAAAARAAGARVARSTSPLGKGGALRRGLAETSGELVVFLDADVPAFEPHWVASLLLPLLRHPEVLLVKAAYDRPLAVDGVVHPASGGRVTRLVALPALNLVAPELTGFVQPLAGETAARRTLLERVRLGDGYAVELGLLLDAYAVAGLDGLAQVDLGERAHRHQSDEALARMATSVLRVAARYAGWPATASGFAAPRRGPDGGWEHHVEELTTSWQPPLVDDRAAPSG
jgi:glucosyl-3-phosphoglycerate synthase